MRSFVTNEAANILEVRHVACHFAAGNGTPLGDEIGGRDAGELGGGSDSGTPAVGHGDIVA